MEKLKIGLLSVFAALLSGTVLALLLTSSAFAADITVSTTTDELNRDGDCSLREAIQAANTDATSDGCVAGAGEDTIVLSTGVYKLLLPGGNEDRNATGDLDIADDLVIRGVDQAEASVIDAAKLDRVLHVEAGVRLIAIDLTLKNGNAGRGNGGALLSEDGQVSLLDVRMVDNVASNGGALAFANMLTARNTAFINNRANEGGAIFHEKRGQAEIVNSLFARNVAVKGAAYFLTAQSYAGASILHSTIVNPAKQLNSAIDIAGGEANIVNTIISGYATGIHASNGTVTTSHNLFYNGVRILDGSGTLVDNGHTLVGKNPGFINPAKDDFRLTVGSAAIDQGQPMGVSTDFYGEVRPLDVGVDIGFDEMQPKASTPAQIQVSMTASVSWTNKSQ